LQNISVKTQNIPLHKTVFPRKTVGFGYWLTHDIARKIENTKVPEITKRMADKGIEACFGENKVIAWCCAQTVAIYKQLRQKYGIKLALPKAIFVEDFAKLNTDNPQKSAFCNWFPAYVQKGSKQVFSERTLFFNSFPQVGNCAWNNINNVASHNHKIGNWATGHFLELFVHEFGHSSHNGNLLEKQIRPKADNIVKNYTKPEFTDKFRKQNAFLQTRLGACSLTDPLETIAHDFSRKVCSSLDENCLPVINTFQASLYPNPRPFLLLRLFLQQKHRQELLMRKIWNGKNI